MSETIVETRLEIGPRAIDAYSRLSYTMWYALAEFIDNSTQSRANYDSIIDQVLQKEGSPLVVSVVHDKVNKTLTIEDNSIGMTQQDLIEALKIAKPTKDSKGRSKYGMGMKTAACWIAKRWKVVTTEWGSGVEWTAEVDIPAIVNEGKQIPLIPRQLDNTDAHYTRIILTDLNRTIQKRTEETIKAYLGSIYRFDIQENRLRLTYNNEPVNAPDGAQMDTDAEGKPYRQEFQTTIGGKPVKGWFGVLRQGAGGRKYGGFSLFQAGRMIQGFPNAWKPRSIFGGVDDEGANNLIAQRLTGVIDLEGFTVSHTKDAILFQDDEEERLELILVAETKAYREYAGRRRGSKGTPWSREKIKDLVDNMKSEFTSDELKDTITTTLLPPMELIAQNNKKLVEAVKEEDKVAVLEITPTLKLTFAVEDRSEFDPHLTISVGAATGEMTVIINRLHPYYQSLEPNDAVEECIRQYLYDGIAEYGVVKQLGRVNPDSVRRLKDQYLRAKVVRIDNRAAESNQQELELLLGTGADK